MATLPLHTRSATTRSGGRETLLIGLSTHEEHCGNVTGVEGDLQAIVGANLRRLRKEAGFSQESFGQHIGWHRTFVGAVERGERNLTLRTVERLCQQLGVHPFDLLWDRSGVGVKLNHGEVLSFDPVVARLPPERRSGPGPIGPGRHR
jgi:transcriptional regulator with XRE-family HTH domain